MDNMGTISIEQLEVMRDHKDALAVRICDMWQNHRWSGHYVQRNHDVSEVKRFLHATSTNDTSNSVTDQSHNTHRPKLAQIADTLEAHYIKALIPNDSWVQFTPEDNDASKSTVRNRIEQYIRNRHRLYDHRSVITKVIRDWIEDMAFTEVVWVSETTKENDAGLKEKAYIGPKVRRIDPDRIAFDSRARTFHDSWKIVQSIKNYGDIALEMEDETLPEDYRSVLAEAMKFRHYARGYGEVFNEEWQYQEYDGFGSNDDYYRRSESVEFLTFYGSIYDIDTMQLHRNRMITVVDRKYILLNEQIETWDGKPYIYASSWRDNPNSLMGMSPLINLTGMQYSINHLQNSKSDILDDVVRPDRVLVGIDDVETQPDGSKHFYSHETGAIVRNVAPDTSILNAEFEIEILERKMEEYAGVPRSAAGIKVPGEQTKFEVQTLSDAGALLFQNKIEKFESDILEKTVNAELELARRKLDQNLNILVSQAEGDIFEDIKPDTLKNKGTLVAKGASHFAQQARMVQELTQFLQNTSARPDVQLHFPAKKIAQAYNRLLGGFGDQDGLYEEFGGIIEQLEAAQFQASAQSQFDEDIISQEQVSNPTLESDNDAII